MRCKLKSSRMSRAVCSADVPQLGPHRATLGHAVSQASWMRGARWGGGARVRAHALDAVLVIEGATLYHVLDSPCSDAFLQLAEKAKSVICCRVTPLQKALVVQLVKSKLKRVRARCARVWAAAFQRLTGRDRLARSRGYARATDLPQYRRRCQRREHDRGGQYWRGHCWQGGFTGTRRAGLSATLRRCSVVTHAALHAVMCVVIRAGHCRGVLTGRPRLGLLVRRVSVPKASDCHPRSVLVPAHAPARSLLVLQEHCVHHGPLLVWIFQVRSLCRPCRAGGRHGSPFPFSGTSPGGRGGG